MNPTDTARALVDELENATKRLTFAEWAQSHFPILRAMILRDEARAALLAYVDTLRIERDGFKELYEEWLTWAKGAVEKCKPEIPPSDSPQAQDIIDERLAHVAGVEQAARDLARHRYALKCEHLNHARQRSAGAGPERCGCGNRRDAVLPDR